MHCPPSTCLRIIWKGSSYLLVQLSWNKAKRSPIDLNLTQVAEIRTDWNSQGEGTFPYLKQGRWSKPKPTLHKNLSVSFRRLTTTLPKTRSIINSRNSYNKCDWKPCTLLARAATPLKYANARKVFSSQCFKVMVKFWRNFFRD